MAYCTKCGVQHQTDSKFCENCDNLNDTNLKEKSPNNSFSIQGASNKITDKLGLDKIEGFSIHSFFSETFRHHESDEVERLLSVGTLDTTPLLSPEMGVMPNPWIFFRVLCGTVIVYLIFLFGWNRFENINLIPGLIIVGSFAVPFSVIILFFELNTPKNISIVRLVQLVMVGGAMSILLSLFIFEFSSFLGVFGDSAAGFVEEIGKLAAVIFVMKTVNSERYKYRLNALLIGAAIGAGFAAFESAGYALRIGILDTNEMLANIQIRGVMSPFAHVAWTAIATSAFWIVRSKFKTTWEALQSPEFIKLFAVPVMLHFVWNLPFEGPFMIKFIVLGFTAWVIIFSLVQSGLKEVYDETKNKSDILD
jgi:RsiW-degrading membrane proteinase PrsW (M82 family)